MRRLLGAIGGFLFGCTVALMLQVLTAFSSSWLVLLFSMPAFGVLTSVVGVFFPSRFEPFSVFIGLFIGGEVELDDWPICAGVAAIAFFVGVFVMLFAVLTQTLFLGFIGMFMITPFSYYSLTEHSSLKF